MAEGFGAKFGIRAAELEHHFSGPSFLAWNRMGNLRAYGGPLPQSYIDDQAGAVLLQDLASWKLHHLCLQWLSLLCCSCQTSDTCRNCVGFPVQCIRLQSWGTTSLCRACTRERAHYIDLCMC